MTKSYYKYTPLNAFGVVVSPTSNVVLDTTGKLAAAGCLDEVVVWNLKQGEPVHRWRDPENESAQVTVVARAPETDVFAAGYTDGSVRLWTASGGRLVTLNGHKSAITSLQFDAAGSRLFSGSLDTDIVAWDVVNQAGLFRLAGHRGAITALCVLERPDAQLDHLVCASKDGLLKIWELRSHQCVDTLIAARAELWAAALTPDGQYLVTGGSDIELRVWRVDAQVIARRLQADAVEQPCLVLQGAIPRQSPERVVQLRFDASGRHLGVAAHDRAVQVFKVRTADEIAKRQKRRVKRLREKGREAADDEAADAAEDLLALLHVSRPRHKARSIDFAARPGKGETLRMVVSTQANTLEMHDCARADAETPTKLRSALDLPGHRSGVRCVALSSDNELLASGSSNSVKVWNLKTGRCVRTLESGFAVCVAFGPGDKSILLGTKTGALQQFELASSRLVSETQAHTGTLYAMHLRPDGQALLTGGADKDVKEWTFGKAGDTLQVARTLHVGESALCVRYSPDTRLIAVSLLDCTVKLYFHDTLKFNLSLYGHKLPVLALDISSDSTLIATGSADKTVKLWGLDFGDCHRSLLAHADSVTAVQFVWGSHYLFTAGKDGRVKYWDADTWECVQQLPGYSAEIWGLVPSKFGEYVVAGGESRCLRVWERSNEHLFVEEEREREDERVLDAEALAAANRVDQAVGSGVDGAAPEASAGPAPTRATLESLRAGERLMEALVVFRQERRDLDTFRAQMRAWTAAGSAEGDRPAMYRRNPFIIATGNLEMSAEEYLLQVVERIPGSELEQAVMLLTFADIVSLLEAAYLWVSWGWNIVLCARVVHCVLSAHHGQISATATLRPLLRELRATLQQRLQVRKDAFGANTVALQCIQAECVQQRSQDYFADISANQGTTGGLGKKAHQKRKRVRVAIQSR